MFEGNTGEGAAPADGVWDPTEDGGDDITQGFPHIEAFVGEFPHAVNGVGVVRLSYGFFKGNLVAERAIHLTYISKLYKKKRLNINLCREVFIVEC